MIEYFDTRFEQVLARTPEKNEPEPKPPKVLLQGDAIATVKINDRRTKVVIFHPCSATQMSVQIWKGANIDLSIRDANGLFSPNDPQIIVDSTYEAGNDVLIVTTQDQITVL